MRNSPESFWSRCVPNGTCLDWTGCIDDGYGHLSWKGETVKAHRLAFFLREGRWPIGVLRHTCHRRACVVHTIEGTVVENNQDTVDAGRHYLKNRTECPRGHTYSEEHTYMNRNGHRSCRPCMRAQKLAWYHRNKGAA